MTGTSSRSPQRRPAFSLLEVLIFLVILGTLTAIALPRMKRDSSQRRVEAAAFAVTADVEAAFSLAARGRRPMRLTYNASSGELRAADRTAGTVHRRRPLRSSSEFQLDSVAMTPATVDFYPNGVATAGFTIAMKNGAHERRVVVTRTGLTRVVVP